MECTKEPAKKVCRKERKDLRNRVQVLRNLVRTYAQKAAGSQKSSYAWKVAMYKVKIYAKKVAGI